MAGGLSRRQFLWGSTAAVGLAAGRFIPFARAATSAPVSLARCDSYGPELVPTLDRMFDQIGGLGRLVKGRTVAVKINLTGSPTHRLRNRPIELAQWVHPRVVGAVAHLMDRAGARRIRVLECPYGTTSPLEDYLYQAGWDPGVILGAAPQVELVNTNWLGNAREYRRFDVPGGGLLFPSFLLNHSYDECDTFVSLTKLKDHSTTGITLSMKNCFGNLPTTVYGGDVPEDEPLEVSMSGRGQVFHQGSRQPCSIAAPELDPTSPRHEGYRIPRVVVDVCGARPIDLAIIDGIASMGGSEGPWAGGEGCEPKALVAGTNCVNTDAVAAAVMGYDPMASQGTPPFDLSDNHLELAERVGLGTRDPSRIEVAGLSIPEARFDFSPMVRSRYPRAVPPYPSEPD
ncbi:MAG: DUF362 domain-containing protein [Acidobacteria bacterium]|jgi:uncharacterized protein (DUF362 family)|nr:DUF362 domain-containing protein [Acidobacteriota bacterium]